jgi:hypothetical protein
MVAQGLTPRYHPLFEPADFLVFSSELCVPEGMQFGYHYVCLLNVGLYGRDVWSCVDHVVLGHRKREVLDVDCGWDGCQEV